MLGLLQILSVILSINVIRIRCNDLPISPEYEAIHGPTTNSISDFCLWYKSKVSSRNKILRDLKYDDSLYTETKTMWSRTNFIQPQVMVHDSYLFDRQANKYTVGKFINDVNDRYGGIDSILLWQAYPNLGIDSRNQFQILEDLPSGGLKLLVDEFHKRNIKVFIPYNPWDTGTHESIAPDYEIIQALACDTKVDGFNGDTMYGVEKRYVIDANNSAVLVAQPECGLPDELLQYNIQSWAYLAYPDSSYYSFAPMVSRPKWLESRHQVQVCNRWATNHTADLQIAWFNGVGFETWENVWGIWNGLSDRDAESIRRISLIYHYFSRSANGATFSINFLERASHQLISKNAVQHWIDFTRWLCDSKSHSLGFTKIASGNLLSNPTLAALATEQEIKEVKSLLAQLADVYPSSVLSTLPESATSAFEYRLSLSSASKLRDFGESASFFTSPDWIPFIPITESYGIFASMFPAPIADETSKVIFQSAIWNIINRLPELPAVVSFDLPCAEDTLVYDLFRGIGPLKPYSSRNGSNFFSERGITPVPRSVPGSDSTYVCSYQLEGSDATNNALVYGGLVSIRAQDVDDSFRAFLELMQVAASVPLASYSPEPHFLTQVMVDYGRVTSTSPPSDMTRIPASPAYEFVVEGVEIESSPTQGGRWVDCQFPWESTPSKYHNHTMAIAEFYIDTYPVTNAQYKRFLDLSGYQPSDGKNFLKGWTASTAAGEGKVGGLSVSRQYPNNSANKPVTWVAVEDATAYCSFLEKRLPSDWEWQYAAQGGVSSRQFPWGDTFDYDAVPQFDSSREGREPDDVDAHRDGASAFGVYDLYGNAWEMTNVFKDERTSFVLLRGGSFYQPQSGTSSGWYIRQTNNLLVHQRQLLMAPSLDRSGMITFRCARDV